MKRGVKVNFDLETISLFIKTNSAVGTNEYVMVLFSDAQDEKAGGFYIVFEHSPRYLIGNCQLWTRFPKILPTESDKVWKITLTKSSGIRIVIHCNDAEVLNVLMSDTTCNSGWNTYWSRDVEKIEFPLEDTASEYYTSRFTPGYFYGAILKS